MSPKTIISRLLSWKGLRPDFLTGKRFSTTLSKVHGLKNIFSNALTLPCFNKKIRKKR